VLWRTGAGTADARADILTFGTVDRAVLRALARIPVGSTILVLGWMTVRMPPFSPGALVSAWWRAFYFRWFCRRRVQRAIDEVNQANRLGAPTAFPSGQSH
jgi:hypothetical protein